MTEQQEREASSPESDERALHIAHDVRNLLQGAAGIAELLEAAERDPERAERLRAMILHVGHASTLLEDLLRWGIGAARPICDFDLGTVALSAAAALRARAGRSLRIELVDPGRRVILRGRENDAIGAVCNLVWNALEAMHAAGATEPRVDLRWGVNRQGPFLEVRDYGPGLPAGFVAGRAPRTEDDGRVHGIGLASVRRVMREHGGALEAATAAGGGAVMRMQFGVQRDLDFEA